MTLNAENFIGSTELSMLRCYIMYVCYAYLVLSTLIEFCLYTENGYIKANIQQVKVNKF